MAACVELKEALRNLETNVGEVASDIAYDAVGDSKLASMADKNVGDVQNIRRAVDEMGERLEKVLGFAKYSVEWALEQIEGDELDKKLAMEELSDLAEMLGDNVLEFFGEQAEEDEDDD